MSNISRLKKVSDSFSVNRYDNGWMIEISGKNTNDDWTTVKIICQSEEEMFKLIATYNTVELDR